MRGKNQYVVLSFYLCQKFKTKLSVIPFSQQQRDLISKSIIAFLYYNVLELPVQMYWDNNEEINKERLYQQALRLDIQHGQTHRPSRTRGIHSQ